ncbi:unnamed protein product [Rotaria socialis]
MVKSDCKKRLVAIQDKDVQIELTAITFDDQQTNTQQHAMSKDVEIKSGSPHKFDNLDLNMNGEELPDQTQAAAVMIDSDNAPGDSMTNNRRIVEAITEESNLKIKNVMNDIRADLGPIVGYAAEPLLPLFEACAPLTNVLYNLSFYVQMALNETPEVPPDGLTIDESAAIRLYTIEWDEPHQSLYSTLNYTLHNCPCVDLRPYFKYLKLFLTALVKLPCVAQVTIWRGITKDLSAEFSPDTLVTWRAFSSCTSALTVLENNIYLGNTGARTLLSVEVINGRTIRAHSHFATEDEILLLPGTRMVVQSQLNPAPDLYIIHLKQIIPEEILLEPPFEGILQMFELLILIDIFLYIGARLYPKMK